ncbi:MAG: GMP/IMP nucleotidase [Methylovulum sp.]|uniref:GMP/IMP nucleotidase n=1 Tax=Methylovulum sp. TaxID=1916980 RepID=UPI00260FDDA6|nr:GMP/IMP nucleotidase [Methylovulum sp.]MDD2723940.1 GMP/IMP nucleotidase [Methylovulum sp.]MDD5125100.1 GMP/IMP nucleotidase [Methylovulum sp.]
MIDWNKIDTVMLDMDGTLLDLNFDNHFWKEFVPQKFAEQQGVTAAEAKQQLIPRFKMMEGQLEWYCLDYWSDALKLDIAGLKAEIAGLITVLPHVTEFLEKVQSSSKSVYLVTNAHRDGLEIKMQKTCLQQFFDGIICSHDLGVAKEQSGFWSLLQQQQPFTKNTTLFVDDNLAVLASARQFGIEHLIAVAKPDSQQPKRDIDGFLAIEDFRELMDGL